VEREHEPVELELAFDEVLVRWRDGRLVWTAGEERRLPAPSPDDWSLFWRAVDRAGAWEWRDRYEAPGVGASWIVRLEHGGRRVRSSGANGFPGRVRASARPGEGFLRFCAAVRALCGGRAFGPAGPGRSR
jgi:hypothetical protein